MTGRVPTSDEIQELGRMFDEVCFAPNKADAATPLRKLEFYASGLSGQLEPYLAGVLSEMVAAAKNCGGNTEAKERMTGLAKQKLYQLESAARRTA